MGIDPEHAESSPVPPVQISHRSQIDEAIASQGHDTIRTMFLDRFACHACLPKQGFPTKDAVLDFQRLSWLYRPRLLGHLIEAYAAKAAG
jgi:hypothetical protein